MSVGGGSATLNTIPDRVAMGRQWEGGVAIERSGVREHW